MYIVTIGYAMPVSYTHLDVYKRQAYTRGEAYKCVCVYVCVRARMCVCVYAISFIMIGIENYNVSLQPFASGSFLFIWRYGNLKTSFICRHF